MSLPRPKLLDEEETALWRARLQRSPCPRRIKRWYEMNAPNSPEHEEFLRRHEAFKRLIADEIQVRHANEHQAAIARKKEAKKLADQERQQRENLDFQERLQLGLGLQLCLDPEDLGLLQHVIHPNMTLQELEKLCLMRDSINRSWFKTILPQVTNNTFDIVGDLITFKKFLIQAEPTPATQHFAIASECQVFEVVEELVISDGSIPTYVNAHTVPVDDAPTCPESSWSIIDHCVHYNGPNNRRFIIKSSVPIVGYENVHFEWMSNFELLRAGTRLCGSGMGDTAIQGGYNAWKTEVQKRLPLSEVTSIALKAGGLQRRATEALIEYILHTSVPRSLSKNVFKILIAALCDEPLPRIDNWH